MKTQRIILIALLWLVSVVVAYFAGSSGEAPRDTHASGVNTVNPAGTGIENTTRESRSVVETVSSSDAGPAGRDEVNIPTLIARARLEMGSGMGGMMNMRGMLRAISPLVELNDSQLQEALVEIEKTIREPQQKMMFYSILLGQWAEKDGKAALDYADKNLADNPMFGMGVKASILGAWARSDPDAAWRWFETEGKESGEDRNKMFAVSTLFAGMAARDLDSAINRLSSLDDSMRPMAINGIAMAGINQEGRHRILDRSATLPAQTRDALRQGALSQWAMAEPEAAIDWLRTLPADEQKPLRSSIAQSVLMMDPKKGGDLLLQGATPEEKPQIYDQIVGRWAYQDAKATGEWLTKQPQGPELDSARMTFAAIAAQKEPAAAMDWARSVTNPEQREGSIRQVYGIWKPRDASAADAALDASGLSADAIESIKKSQPGQSQPTQLQPTIIRPSEAIRR